MSPANPPFLYCAHTSEYLVDIKNKKLIKCIKKAYERDKKMKEAIKTLLDTGNKALIIFTKKDLLGEEVNIEELWTLPQVKKY